MECAPELPSIKGASMIRAAVFLGSCPRPCAGADGHSDPVPVYPAEENEGGARNGDPRERCYAFRAGGGSDVRKRTRLSEQLRIPVQSAFNQLGNRYPIASRF